MFWAWLQQYSKVFEQRLNQGNFIHRNTTYKILVDGNVVT